MGVKVYQLTTELTLLRCSAFSSCAAKWQLMKTRLNPDKDMLKHGRLSKLSKHLPDANTSFISVAKSAGTNFVT
jgi:hypothetical protein